jgi:hypothetical protein
LSSLSDGGGDVSGRVRDSADRAGVVLVRSLLVVMCKIEFNMCEINHRRPSTAIDSHRHIEHRKEWYTHDAVVAITVEMLTTAEPERLRVC